MRHFLARRAGPFILVLGLVATPVMLLAQTPPVASPAASAAKAYKAKLTPWGEPDMRGTWPIDYLNGVPLQRDPKYGNRAFLTDEEYAEAHKRQDALQGRYDNDAKNGKIGRGHWDEAGRREPADLADHGAGQWPPCPP